MPSPTDVMMSQPSQMCKYIHDNHTMTKITVFRIYTCHLGMRDCMFNMFSFCATQDCGKKQSQPSVYFKMGGGMKVIQSGSTNSPVCQLHGSLEWRRTWFGRRSGTLIQDLVFGQRKHFLFFRDFLRNLMQSTLSHNGPLCYFL